MKNLVKYFEVESLLLQLFFVLGKRRSESSRAAKAARAEKKNENDQVDHSVNSVWKKKEKNRNQLTWLVE